MVITVEMYAQIRKLFGEGKSSRKIAKELGISRNTVKKYREGGAKPGQRKTPERHAKCMTQEVADFIQQCLDEDAKEGLKTQRHTARQIFMRLQTEKNFTGSESTVRRKVHDLKTAIHKALIPLDFEPGEAMK